MKFLRSLKKITLIHTISRFKVHYFLFARIFFIKLHGISTDRVCRICTLLIQNKIPEDYRGKNRSVNAISGEICRKVYDHFQRFEVKQTHYVGKPKQYLYAWLDLVKIHKLFIKEHPDLEGIVKYHLYYTYFKENFDYAFGCPQVDRYMWSMWMFSYENERPKFEC